METTWKRRVKEYDNTQSKYFAHFQRDNGLPFYQTQSWNHVAFIDKMGTYGYDIPNFRRRMRSGELMPMTPFRQHYQFGSSTGSYHIVNSLAPYNEGKIEPDGLANLSNEWIITDDQLALLIPPDPIGFVQEAAAKIWSKGFDALTFVAELKDVHRMFIQTGRRIVHLKPPKNWKHYSSDWLSYRYGWRPLINDISSLIKLVTSVKSKTERISERVGMDIKTSDTTTVTNPNGIWCDVVQTIHDDIQIGLRGSVVADIAVPEIQFNPIATGWELIPFSFVMDWFVSVGKTIAAHSFLNAAAGHVSASGINLRVHRTLTREDTNWMQGVSGRISQNATCTSLIQVRTPCNVPILPHFRVRLDSKKIIDLLALVIQRWR